MIVENRIIFGHGTVLVGISILPSAITFQTSATAHPIGSLLEPGTEQSGEKISVPLNIEHYAELSKNLMLVENRKLDTFSFCGYHFDFTTYNPESIQVVREKAKTAMCNYLMAVAC